MRFVAPSVVALGLMLLTGGSARAAVIIVGDATMTISAQGLVASQTAEQAFLMGLGGFVTESFEGFTAGTRADVISTAVGDFRQVDQGSGGLCGANCDGLLIDSLGSPPAYVGRFPIDGDLWLDSNDSTESVWQRMGDAPTSLGFFITDPNDQGARINVTVTDASENSVTFMNVFGGALVSGTVFYITIGDPNGIDSINIFQRDEADGFGIDRFTTAAPPGRVPEPAILGLLGLSLLALYRSRRSRDRA